MLPVPAPLAPILKAWADELFALMRAGEKPKTVLSRRTAWRTMRRALGLPKDVIPKTIRHTIATELRRRGVPPDQISVLLGHRPPDLHPTTEVYAKYDPRYLSAARRELGRIMIEVQRHAERWAAAHLRMKSGNGRVLVVEREERSPARSHAEAKAASARRRRGRA